MQLSDECRPVKGSPSETIKFVFFLCAENDALTSSTAAAPKPTKMTSKTSQDDQQGPSTKELPSQQLSKQPVPDIKELPVQPVPGTKERPLSTTKVPSQLVPGTDKLHQLKDEVTELREAYDRLRRQCDRHMKQLQDELDDERAARQQLMADFERLKKIVATKLRSFWTVTAGSWSSGRLTGGWSQYLAGRRISQQKKMCVT